jgi:uncharacterized protein (TIGR00369 family)
MEQNQTEIMDDPTANEWSTSLTSGLDHLKAIKQGKESLSPVAKFIGYSLTEVENGYAVFEFDPAGHHYNILGSVHGGIISAVLDSTMTASVISTLEKGYTCSTVEFKVNFVRPVTIKSGHLRCEAAPSHLGRRLATVEGKLKDQDGNLYALGIGTCIISKVTL